MPEITTTEQRNQWIVGRFGEAQAGGNLDLLDELVADDFVRHCPATPWLEVRNREEFKQFLKEDRAAVPDGRVTPLVMFGAGEYVAIWAQYAGTQRGAWGQIPATNKRFKLDVSMIFRVKDDKIAELWVTWDNLSLLRQLGLGPG